MDTELLDHPEDLRPRKKPYLLIGSVVFLVLIAVVFLFFSEGEYKEKDNQVSIGITLKNEKLKDFYYTIDKLSQQNEALSNKAVSDKRTITKVSRELESVKISNKLLKEVNKIQETTIEAQKDSLEKQQKTIQALKRTLADFNGRKGKFSE